MGKEWKADGDHGHGIGNESRVIPIVKQEKQSMTRSGFTVNMPSSVWSSSSPPSSLAKFRASKMSSLSAIVNKAELKFKKRSGGKCRHSNLPTYIHWNSSFAVYTSSSKPWPLQRPLSPPPPHHTHTKYSRVYLYKCILLSSSSLPPHHPLTPFLPLSEYHGPQHCQAQFIKILHWHMSLNCRSRQGQFQGGRLGLGYYCFQIVFVPNAMI